MLSHQTKTDNQSLGTDSHVQLAEVPVWTYKRDKVIAQGIAPCVRPGMLIHDTERNQYGTAKLCTANAVNYTTPDGKEFTIAYNDISLQAAGPDTSTGDSTNSAASTIDVLPAFDGQYPETQGARMHDGGELGGVDTRFGVPVPIGALVWANECEGVLVDATDQLAILVDEKGLQHAERWGAVQVQASGPARASTHAEQSAPSTAMKDAPACPADETGMLQLNADQIEQIGSDPYRIAGLRLLDLIAFIESMKEDVESIEDDRIRAIDQLCDLEALIGQIGDNRARRIISPVESEVIE